jgi:hypothetical protein
MLLIPAIGIGMGVKHLYVAYAGGPLLYLLMQTLFSGKMGFKSRLRMRWPILAGLTIGTILGTAYHLLNRHVILEQVHRAIVAPDQGPISYAESVRGLILLLMPVYPELHLALFGIGCICAGLIARQLILYPLLLIAGGYLGVSYGTQQPWSYYLLPLLPSSALLCAAIFRFDALFTRHNRRMRLALTTFGVCVALLLAGIHVYRRLGTANPVRLLGAWHLLFQSKQSITSNPLSDTDYWSSGHIDGNASLLPYPHDWKTGEISQVIGEAVRNRTGSRPLKVKLMARLEWMNDMILRQKLFRAGLEDKAALIDSPFYLFKTPDDILLDANVLVIKSPVMFGDGEYRNSWAIPVEQLVKNLIADDGRLLKDRGFVLRGSFPLPDHTTATVWVDKQQSTSTSLFEEFDRVLMYPPKNAAVISAINVADETRAVLFQHPVTAPHVAMATWGNLDVTPGAHFKFGIGIDQGTWGPNKGDGVEFQVVVRENGVDRTIFSKYIDPKHNLGDRKWFDFDLPIGATANHTVDLSLITRPGPKGDITSDHAGWSNLRILP